MVPELQARLSLPVRHGCVEDLISDILGHLRHEFFLNGIELLGGIIFGRGGKGAFEVLLVVGIVEEAHVDGHLELYLTASSVSRDTFVELVETGYLTSKLQVTATLDLLQTGLRGIDVRQLILEDGLHGSPHVSTAYREIVDLDGLDHLVVYAGTVELIGNDAGGQGGDDEGHTESTDYGWDMLKILQYHSL